MRLLDVGCGWGGMVRHAAEHYGVTALGVTLSRAAGRVGARRRSSARASTDLAEVRHLDYRDVPETGFDAVSSIGLTEHIGVQQLPGLLLASCATSCAPGGRLLNHCITRPRQPRRRRRGRVHRPLRLPRRRADRVRARSSPTMQDAGLEVRHEENLREHYALTLRGLVRATSTRTGTSASPRSARAPRGCGASTWPGRGSASSATRSSCTRCWRVKVGPRRRRRSSRCGPTGGAD